MIAPVAFGLFLSIMPPPGAWSSPGDLAAYRVAAEGVWADPAANVRLALWCEAHGLDAERAGHLARALRSDPTNATARGLSGMVNDGGRWLSPAELAAKTRSDEALGAALAEYNARREAMPPHETAEAHWALAVWCESKGLKPEAVAHLTAVTRLDPGRSAAWRKLGYVRSHGRWRTEAQVKAEDAEGCAQSDADRRWGEQLRRWWRGWLALSDPQARDEDLAAFARGLEPRAVPTVRRLFARGDASQQSVEVALLDRIDAPEASRELARLAVVGRDATVRGGAVSAIARRDATEAIDPLVATLHLPLRIDVHPAPGAVGALELEDEDAILEREYRQLTPPRRVNSFEAGRGPAWLLVPLTPKVPRNRPSAQRMLETDVARAEAVNRRREDLNARVAVVLTAVTGENLGNHPESWRRWWSDQQGVAYDRASRYEKPVIRRVRVSDTPPSGHCRCFAKGTLVQTVLGPRPIEGLAVGDRVLTADVSDGALEVRPIVAVHVNPPSPTLRLGLGTGQVVTTPIHRFWKAGKGWVLARDLRPGDAVRVIDGVVHVVSIAPDEVQPVYNLEVSESQSFFVGERGVLVHDYSATRTVTKPFDAVAFPR